MNAQSRWWTLIRTVRRSLTTDSTKSLVHALIANRLDYCNSVLYRINTNATKILQSVLHSATRLIMRKRKFDSITPTIRDDLHWLPVPQRIDYKLCMIIYRCLHQTAPVYLQDLWVPVSTTASRRHRSCVQLLAVTYKFWQPKLLLSGLAASLRVPPNSGTVYHCHSAIRHWAIRQPAENSSV